MKIVPTQHKNPTAREFFERRMFLLGIDRAKWPRLWAVERAKVEEARKAQGYRPGNRHGRRG